MVVLLLDIKRVSTGMGGAPGGLDFVRNASTILGFNIFLQTPERLGKDHDEVVALAAAKKNRAFRRQDVLGRRSSRGDPSP
jgi:hypothetical protein